MKSHSSHYYHRNCWLIGAAVLFVILGGEFFMLYPQGLPGSVNLIVFTGMFFFLACYETGKAHAAMNSREPKKVSVEDRLDELERLKRRDMVTPGEYAAKRQEILKDL